MIGAMFWMRKAVMGEFRKPVGSGISGAVLIGGLLGIQQALRLRLGRGVVAAARGGVFQVAADDGDALDQLGDRLQRTAA